MARDPREVISRRWRIGAALTAVMMLGYFGFVLLVAYGKETTGHLIADGRVSVGIVLGAAVIVLAPVLTAVYVRWANRHYDPAVDELRAAAGSEAARAKQPATKQPATDAAKQPATDAANGAAS